jgi:hypothetical protein
MYQYFIVKLNLEGQEACLAYFCMVNSQSLLIQSINFQELAYENRILLSTKMKQHLKLIFSKLDQGILLCQFIVS